MAIFIINFRIWKIIYRDTRWGGCRLSWDQVSRLRKKEIQVSQRNIYR
jgi:hypothetical protein